MGQMRVLCQKGDVKSIWNPDNDVETKAARDMFDKLIKEGYTAYRVDEEGEKNGKMKTFDKSAGKVILVPRVVGG